MTVIHRPSADHRVELLYQRFLSGARITLDDSPDFLKQRFDALPRWPDQHFAVVLAHVLAKEIETLRYMRDPGFLLREFQPTLGHEAPDRRQNSGFEHFFRSAGHHKIVGVTDNIEFGLAAREFRSTHACIYCSLKSI